MSEIFKSVDEVLDTNENVYLWEDNKTLDICYFDTKTSFIKLINDSTCLRCTTPIIAGNEKFLTYMTDTVRGMKLTCCKCKQKYFIHIHVGMIEAQPKN